MSSAKMEEDCHANPAGKILDKVTSAVTLNRSNIGEETSSSLVSGKYMGDAANSSLGELLWISRLFEGLFFSVVGDGATVDMWRVALDGDMPKTIRRLQLDAMVRLAAVKSMMMMDNLTRVLEMNVRV